MIGSHIADLIGNAAFFLLEGHDTAHVHQVDDDVTAAERTDTVHALYGQGEFITFQRPLDLEIIAVQHNGTLAAGFQLDPGLALVDITHGHGKSAHRRADTDVLTRIGVFFSAAGCQRKQHGKGQQECKYLFHMNLFPFCFLISLWRTFLPCFSRRSA